MHAYALGAMVFEILPNISIFAGKSLILMIKNIYTLFSNYIK